MAAEAEPFNSGDARNEVLARSAVLLRDGEAEEAELADLAVAFAVEGAAEVALGHALVAEFGLREGQGGVEPGALGGGQQVVHGG